MKREVRLKDVVLKEELGKRWRFQETSMPTKMLEITGLSWMPDGDGRLWKGGLVDY